MGKKSIKDFFQKNGGALAVPLVMIVIGLLFVLFPGSAIDLTVKIIGIIFISIGLIVAGTLIASYSSFTLTISIVLIVLGLLIVILSGTLVHFVLATLGIIILLNSALRIYDAYKIKGKTNHFIKYVINDIITLVLGIVLVLMGKNVAETVVMILGIILLVLGVSNIITVIRVYRDGRFVDDGTDVVWEE